LKNDTAIMIENGTTKKTMSISAGKASGA